jgi:hypothetical protein
VREDPEREGLLYAGTEFGLFASFNDGETWQSLQQNLPTTRVADLQVAHGDLVVATHGRSFWIMDDLTPLRQLTRQVADADMHLYDPRPAHIANPSSGGDHEDREPQGPAAPAFLNYAFAEVPDTTVTLEIRTASGETVRHFTTDSTAAAEDHTKSLLALEAGMNRMGWNLTGTPVHTVDDAIVWGYTGGPKAVPGTYIVRLSVAGGATQTQDLELRMDPRIEDVTVADLQASHDLATTIRDTLTNVYDAVRMIRSVRDQMQFVAQHAEEAGHGGDLMARADSIGETLSSIEQELMQVKNESFQDPLNYPPMLDNQYAYLYGYVAMPDGPPTAGARQRFADLNEQWSTLRGRLMDVMNTEVQAFNERVRAVGPPVFVPSASTP